MVEVNFEGNYFISISMDTSNAILINKVRKSFCNIGLNFNLQENGDELLETTLSILPCSLTAPPQVTTAITISSMVRTVTGFAASWARQFLRQRDGEVDQNQQGRFYLYRGHVDAYQRADIPADTAAVMVASHTGMSSRLCEAVIFMR